MTTAIGFDAGPFIRRVVAGADLSRQEMQDIVGAMAAGEVSGVQCAALLVALAAKGESAEEIVGAVSALRDLAPPVVSSRGPVVDVCGTGGDGIGSFNVSTAVAFVVAGAGVAVAKHGNRAMSSTCGSADVLEALGVSLDSKPNDVECMLDAHGIAFLFAQHYYPTLRAIASVRREIGVRTLFNLIGPLCNPARPARQLIGVSQVRALPLLAKAAAMLGSERAAIVCADDGMDEASLSCSTRVVEWTGGTVVRYSIAPEAFGFARRPAEEVEGGTSHRNAEVLRNVLLGVRGPHRDIVVLNAALALYVAGAAQSVRDGVCLAGRSIDSKAAYQKLEVLVANGQ